MGSGGEGGRPRWSVYDGISSIPSTPESLMSEVNAAISYLEYTRATTLLNPSPSSSSDRTQDASEPQYDARMADEAYRSGCAALATGKLDDALHSLQLSLSKCPPYKTSAVSKLQSLITLTSQQLHKSNG